MTTPFRFVRLPLVGLILLGLISAGFVSGIPDALRFVLVFFVVFMLSR